MAIISKSWLLKHFFESENQQKIKFYIMKFIVFLFFFKILNITYPYLTDTLFLLKTCQKRRKQ